jgi:hypothetical protein
LIIIENFKEYRNTFAILAIIKLFSINAFFFSKLIVHNVGTSQNYIVVYYAWSFLFIPSLNG